MTLQNLKIIKTKSQVCDRSFFGVHEHLRNNAVLKQQGVVIDRLRQLFALKNIKFLSESCLVKAMSCVTQNVMNCPTPYYVVCLISDIEILLNSAFRNRIPIVRLQLHAVGGWKIAVFTRSPRIPPFPYFLIRCDIIHYLSVCLVGKPKQTHKQNPCEYHRD